MKPSSSQKRLSFQRANRGGKKTPEKSCVFTRFLLMTQEVNRRLVPTKVLRDRYSPNIRRLSTASRISFGFPAQHLHLERVLNLPCVHSVHGTCTLGECSCCRYSGFLHSIFILNECAVSRVYTRVNKFQRQSKECLRLWGGPRASACSRTVFMRCS